MDAMRIADSSRLVTQAVDEICKSNPIARQRDDYNAAGKSSLRARAGGWADPVLALTSDSAVNRQAGEDHAGAHGQGKCAPLS